MARRGHDRNRRRSAAGHRAEALVLAVSVLAVSVLAAGCSATVPGRAMIAATTTSTGTTTSTPADTPAPPETSWALPGPALSTTSSPTTSYSTTSNPTTTPTGRASSPAPRPTPGGTNGSPTPAEGPAALRAQHDTALATLLTGLSRSLVAGNQASFLTPFARPLTDRVRHWFGNTRALGVDGALFAPADDYSSGATDTATSFTRTVVVGIRTPYDDPGSMPGISYAVTITTGRGSTAVITAWQPKYLGDPMNCDCTLQVTHDEHTAVVADTADADLVFWSPAALRADAGIDWARAQLTGTGLVAPRGSVVFLADKPFHWFLSIGGLPQDSNVTAGLVDASGTYPGSRYSDQSRIVLLLESSDGSTVPNDARGRQYAEDVLTHESTHQLMNRNSTLPERSPNSPPTWVVEGIAVAVETLHRDALGDAGDIGYPEPNDPKNIARQWFVDHLGAQMPTPAQLYSKDGAAYYAISGSVFRYLAQKYDYVTMMKVAKSMYAAPAQTPFTAFPDPAHPGKVLPAAAAKAAWKSWFVANYE